MSKVYRNISVPLRVFGLDLYDLLFLLLLFLVVFNVSENLILNGLALLFFIVLIRIFKKGKPEGYLLHLLKFIISPTKRHVVLEKKRRTHESH